LKATLLATTRIPTGAVPDAPPVGAWPDAGPLTLAEVNGRISGDPAPWGWDFDARLERERFNLGRQSHGKTVAIWPA
jgi:hypothetical protein